MDSPAQHDAHENVPQAYASPWKTPGGVNGWLVAVVGVVSTLVFYVIVTSADAWFRNMTHAQQTNYGWKQVDLNLAAYRQEQQQRLGTLHYTTDDKKTVALPMEQAMDAYLQLKAQPGNR